MTESHLDESFVVVSVRRVPFPLPPLWTPELVRCCCVKDILGMWSNMLSILGKISLPAGVAEGYWSWL